MVNGNEIASSFIVNITWNTTSLGTPVALGGTGLTIKCAADPSGTEILCAYYNSGKIMSVKLTPNNNTLQSASTLFTEDSTHAYYIYRTDHKSKR